MENADWTTLVREGEVYLDTTRGFRRCCASQRFLLVAERINKGTQKEGDTHENKDTCLELEKGLLSEYFTYGILIEARTLEYDMSVAIGPPICELVERLCMHVQGFIDSHHVFDVALHVYEGE
jgi:hypothetical protein